MSLAANQLADPSIREAYKEALKNNRVISKDEIQAIIEAARDSVRTRRHGSVDDVITETEARDLEKIRDFALLSFTARDELNQFIKDREKERDPSKRRKLTEEESNRVAGTLRELGAKVAFEDPVFKVQYNSENYNKIASRIRSGDVTVYVYEYIADDFYAGRARGLYNSGKNNLSYTNQKEFRRTWSTILHEATHGIQDIVINQNMRVWHAEAMAHLAQAICIIQAYGDGVLFDRVAQMKNIAKSVIKSKKVSKDQLDALIEIIKPSYPDNRVIHFLED